MYSRVSSQLVFDLGQYGVANTDFPIWHCCQLLHSGNVAFHYGIIGVEIQQILDFPI